MTVGSGDFNVNTITVKNLIFWAEHLEFKSFLSWVSNMMAYSLKYENK